MKKLIFTFFIILFLPINILAYSNNVLVGGETIGINLNTDGLIVVGFYSIDNEYIAKKSIKIGDRITKVNGITVNDLNNLTEVINDNIDNDSVDIELVRNDTIINTKLYLKEEDGLYKTGLYVKDSVTGIGTLTYIDPISKIYGALGHEIILNETNNKVEVRDGNILMSKITSINKSRNGHVGSKNANIFYNKVLGNVIKNTSQGIFGYYTNDLPKKNTMEISSFNDIKLGEAYILTVTHDNNIKEYKINILDKYNNKRNTSKSFSFEIIDDNLINDTGGIVQGMSGSPIIQDNKLIGGVTNVVIDNVKLGYGISIITMLEEGDKIKN